MTTDEGYRDETVNEDASIAGFDANFVDVDGIRTRYYDVGSGEPLVLLHGGSWTGFTSANTWSRNFAGLGENFRVLALDRVGNGMTDNPATVGDYRWAAEPEHVEAFLDVLGLDEVHLAGQSRGGGLAGWLAVDNPEIVKSLTIVNSATLAPSAGDYVTRRDRLHRSAPDDPDSPTYYRDLCRHREEVMAYSTDHITEEYVRAGAYMRTRPKAMQTAEVLGNREGPYWERESPVKDRWQESLHEHMREMYRRIDAGALTMPTLLYWGINDPTVRFRAGIALYDRIAQQNSDVRLYTVNEAGHHPYREHPTDFNRTVAHFVETFDAYG